MHQREGSMIATAPFSVDRKATTLTVVESLCTTAHQPLENQSTASKVSANYICRTLSIFWGIN